MGYIIAFIAGTMAGVTLMCIVSVTPKGQQEDEEQMEYLKEWNNKHGNNKKIKENPKLEILQAGIDGISGILHMAGLRHCTVVASWGGGWEHVSVCPSNRLPDWTEMCAIKDMFWNDDEVVMQLHPAKNNYVNLMPNCLHLWRPIGQEIPVPPILYV